MGGACLPRLLETLEKNLPATSKPQPPVSSEDIHDAMRTLNALLRARLIETLLTKALEKHLENEYIRKLKPGLGQSSYDKSNDGEEPS